MTNDMKISLLLLSSALLAPPRRHKPDPLVIAVWGALIASGAAFWAALLSAVWP